MYMHCCACYRWRRAATGLPSRSGHSGEHDGRWAESEPEGTLPILPALLLPPLPHPCPSQPLLQQPQREDTILNMGTCVYDGLIHYISRLSSCRASLLCSQLFEHIGGSSLSSRPSLFFKFFRLRIIKTCTEWRRPGTKVKEGECSSIH